MIPTRRAIWPIGSVVVVINSLATPIRTLSTQASGEVPRCRRNSRVSVAVLQSATTARVGDADRPARLGA